MSDLLVLSVVIAIIMFALYVVWNVVTSSFIVFLFVALSAGGYFLWKKFLTKV